MANGMEILATQRLTDLVEELRERRQIPGELRFLNRLAEQPATDAEIRGYFTGHVLISDIIFEGQKAITKNADEVRAERTVIPKVKHGVLIDEETVVMLERINAGLGSAGDNGMFRDYVTRKTDDILLGIRQRKNSMAVAMLLDTFSYDNGAIVVSGASWQTPAELKITVSVLWSNPTTATPIKDLTSMNKETRKKWGKVYNRATMSFEAFEAAVATDEFKAKAQLYSQINFPTGSWPLIEETEQLQVLFERISGFQIEIEDAQYADQAPSGEITYKAYMPEEYVILTNTQDDNQPSVAFMGQAIVPETIVSSIARNVPGIQGPFGGPQTGPVAYAEIPSLNPPDVTIWGVDKCWPVKRQKQMSARLKVL